MVFCTFIGLKKHQLIVVRYRMVLQLLKLFKQKLINLFVQSLEKTLVLDMLGHFLLVDLCR